MKENDSQAKCYTAPSVEMMSISIPSLYAASPVPGAAGGYDSDDDIFGPDF